MFFHVNDLLFLAEKDQIDREKHSNCVDAAGRYDPETAARLGPSLGSSKKSNKARKIAIGDRRFRGYKRLLRFVVDVYGMVVTVARHTSPSPYPPEGGYPLSLMNVVTRRSSACGAK